MPLHSKRSSVRDFNARTRLRSAQRDGRMRKMREIFRSRQRTLSVLSRFECVSVCASVQDNIRIHRVYLFSGIWRARNTDIFMYAQVMRNALNSGRRARATEGVRL